MRTTSLLLTVLLLTPIARADSPETVAITYRFTKADEAPLRAAIDRHWATGTRLGLFIGEHRLYRGNGFLLEILTWRDASIPDDAPADILAAWAEMNRHVDKNRGGLTIEEVHLVTAGD